jgi:hypothetical protein
MLRKVRKRLDGERFWKYVKKTYGGCWLWTGSSGKANPRSEPYGRFWVLCGLRLRCVRPHVLSYQMHVDDPQPGMVVMHTCDNTLCVNPAHLREGTRADNLHDALRKGRFRGLRMTPEILRAMRDMRASGRTVADVALAVGFSRHSVSRWTAATSARRTFTQREVWGSA